MERKTIKFDVKAVDEEKGIIEGYGSTFDDTPDSYGDVVDKGAFTKTIKENGDSIVSLFNHMSDFPIGKPELSEDGKGLLTRIHLVRGVAKAEETLLLAKAGVIKRMSIGYETIKQEMDKGIRHLKEVRLYDVSPVIFAANPNAMITDIKSELEQLLKSGRVLSASSRGKVQSALTALQALLVDSDGEEEPEKSTPEPEETKEAAELESILSSIQADMDGFDSKRAEARIDELLSKINMEVKANA